MSSIQALGGRVESKVPRAGFVLVQPGTTEEERLRLCWASRDRPDRFFVPYTYVDACKISQMFLKQVFLEDGQPIRMHIDSSIANVNVRATLSARIMVSFCTSDFTSSVKRYWSSPPYMSFVLCSLTVFFSKAFRR